jgi:hypothetical protein
MGPPARRGPRGAPCAAPAARAARARAARAPRRPRSAPRVAARQSHRPLQGVAVADAAGAWVVEGPVQRAPAPRKVIRGEGEGRGKRQAASSRNPALPARLRLRRRRWLPSSRAARRRRAQGDPEQLRAARSERAAPRERRARGRERGVVRAARGQVPLRGEAAPARERGAEPLLRRRHLRGLVMGKTGPRFVGGARAAC